jgi:hypothetical protein
MRVLVAGLGRFHESAVETEAYADEVRRQYGGTPTALGGFLAAAEENGLDVLPLAVVSVGPAGAVSRETFETLRTRIFSELRGWKIDAVYLALGGATPILVKSSRDEPSGTMETYAEVELLAALQTRLGSAVPFAATTDFNPVPAVTAALAQYARVYVTPAFLPGADAWARGVAAMQRLRAVLPREVRAPALDELWAPQEAILAMPAILRQRPTHPAVCLILPGDPSCGAAPGEAVPLGLALHGLNGRSVSVGWFICDELGEVRWDTREAHRVDSDVTLLRFVWPVQPGDPPGIYSIRALVWSPQDRWQGIATGTIEVVDPAGGHRAPVARFPAVPRDRLLEPRYTFPATPRAELLTLFECVDQACRAAQNPDGSWGNPSRDRRSPHHISIYARTAETSRAYLLAYQIFGDERFAIPARRGLDFLLASQLPNGGWCPWTFTWITPQWVFLQEACFYDTGWVAHALLEGARILGERDYLEAVQRAATYALTAPYTGNNNYDAFLLWYLGPFAQLTGDTRYLEHAITRCREAVLPGEHPWGGFPAHNLSTGYQAIIAYGLLALYQALPAAHWYRPALRRATLMALNFLIWLQDRHGDFYTGWEYDRTFGVTVEGLPRGSSTTPAGGLLVEVFRCAAAQFALDERMYHALCAAVMRRAATGPGHGSDLLALAGLLAWDRRWF